MTVGKIPKIVLDLVAKKLGRKPTRRELKEVEEAMEQNWDVLIGNDFVPKELNWN